VSTCCGCAFLFTGNLCPPADCVCTDPVIYDAVAVVAVLVLTFLLTNKYDNTRSHFKQFIDFVQLMDILYRSLPSTAVLSMEQMGVFSLVSMNARAMLKTMDLPCLAPMEPLTKFLVVTYGQPVLLFGMWFVALVGCRCWSCKRQRPFPKRQFYHSFWQLVLLCFSTLNYTGFSLLSCRSVGSARVLVSDDAVVCTGSGYAVAAAIGLSISVMISAVVPAVIFIAHKRRGHVPTQGSLARIVSASSFRTQFSKPEFDDGDAPRPVSLDGAGVGLNVVNRSPVKTVSFRVHHSEKVRPFDTTALDTPDEFAKVAQPTSEAGFRYRNSTSSPPPTAGKRPPVATYSNRRDESYSGNSSPVRRRFINKHFSSISTGSLSDGEDVGGVTETDGNLITGASEPGGTVSGSGSLSDTSDTGLDSVEPILQSFNSRKLNALAKYAAIPSRSSQTIDTMTQGSQADDRLPIVASHLKSRWETVMISSSPSKALKCSLPDPIPVQPLEAVSSEESDSELKVIRPVTVDSQHSLKREGTNSNVTACVHCCTSS
jgi:hypothetical protein